MLTKIALVPDLAQLSAATGRENAGFSGTVQIDVEVLRPVEAITLNATNIVIARAIIDGAVSKVEIDHRSQTAKLTPLRPLGVGRHTLAIEYSGTILTRQEGLFYSTYDTPAGRRWTLATDLEPAGARRVFPGWDEPVFKATFELSVTVPANFRALSNMPVAGEQRRRGGAQDRDVRGHARACPAICLCWPPGNMIVSRQPRKGSISEVVLPRASSCARPIRAWRCRTHACLFQ